MSAGAPALRITEIYRSIQGEGTRAGRPCTLVRLTGCNLRCTWCDTAYAFHGGRELGVPEVLDRVGELAVPLVLVTGGEPLIQPASHALMGALCDAGYEVIVETGGSLDVTQVDPRVCRIVDIKCPGSGEAHRNRWENLAVLGPRDELKLVIRDRSDFAWGLDAVRDRGVERQGVTVLWSPVHGMCPPADLAEWMLESGAPGRLQVQLHRILWPQRDRGV